ncbi:MAG: O-antigen ligase family protein [Candidatus Hydrogenedentota bacterium]
MISEFISKLLIVIIPLCCDTATTTGALIVKWLFLVILTFSGLCFIRINNINLIKFERIMIVCIIISLISSFYVVNRIDLYKELVHLLTLISVYILFRENGSDFLKILLLIFVVGSGLAIYGYLNLYNFFIGNWEKDSGMIATFGNPNFFGEYLVFILPIGIFLTIRAYSDKFITLFLLSSTIFIFYVIYRTQSEGALIGALTSIFIIFCYYFIKVFNKKLKIYSFILILVFITLSGIYLYKKIFPLSSSRLFRLYSWQSSIMMIKEAKAGIAYGQFNLVYPLYRLYEEKIISGKSRVESPHNEFLYIAVEAGLVTSILFFTSVIIFSLTVLRSHSDLLPFAAGVFGAISNSFFTYNLHNPGTSFMFFMYLGLIARRVINQFQVEFRGKKQEARSKITENRNIILIVPVMLWCLSQLTADIHLRYGSLFHDLFISQKNLSYAEQAIKHLSLHERLEKDPRIGYYRMGMIYRDAYNDYKRSRDYFIKAIKSAPYFEDYINSAGDVLLKSGNADGVICFVKALRIHPGYAEAWGNCGLFYESKKDYERALNYYESGFGNDPSITGLARNAGALLFRLNEFTRSLKWFYKELLRSGASRSDAEWLNAGLSLDKLGETETAINFYNKAIELNHKNIDAICSLGIIYFKKGEIEKAKSYFQKVIDTAGKPNTVNIAESYLKLCF